MTGWAPQLVAATPRARCGQRARPGSDKLVTPQRAAGTSAGLGARGGRVCLVTGVAGSCASDGAATKRSATSPNPISQRGRGKYLGAAAHGVLAQTEDADLEATAAGALVPAIWYWPGNPRWGTASSHPTPRRPGCGVPGTSPGTIGNPSCWFLGGGGR